MKKILIKNCAKEFLNNVLIPAQKIMLKDGGTGF